MLHNTHAPPSWFSQSLEVDKKIHVAYNATMKKNKDKKVDPQFDGHLSMDVRTMSTEEKLMYLSRQIELRHFIGKNVKKVSK